MTEASRIGLLEATVSFGALLYLAALGEMITEKAGILNLGVEGMMAIGAVTGFVVALQTGNPWVALVAAIAAATMLAAAFAKTAMAALDLAAKADKIAKSAAAGGASAAEWQKVIGAFELAGLSADQTEMAIKKLGLRIG